MLKRLICAVVVSSACVGAHAATIDLGPVSSDVPKSFGGSAPVGDFSQLFAFSLPANGGSGYSILNFPLDVSPAGTFNTLLNTMSLISNPDGVLTPNGDEVTLHTVVGAGVDSLSLPWGPTAAGNMLLQVTGITNGSLGGIYTGAISVSPVPEPEVWAMMLVGAGLVGFQLRRKSKQASVHRFV